MRPKKPNIGMKCLGPRVMSALQVWLWLLIFIFQNEFRISYGTEPGYLDFDNLPDTNFSCAGKVIGGYYADLETDCQMFHVCTIGQHEEPMDIKFLCLNGTVFDQETRVCERVDEVDCSKSERFYSLNLELYGNTAPPIIKEESIENSEEDIEDDYSDVYEEPSTTTVKTTKMTTTTTTTTPRPTTMTTTRPYHTTPKPTYYQTTLHEYQHETDVDDEDDIYDVIDDNTSADVSNHTSSENSKEQYNRYNVDSQVPRPLGNNNNNQYEENDSGEDLKPTVVNDNSQVFSPEEFIYHHNKQSFALKTPAISFQQHSYTSNGQNSHVTVTTHTGKGNYNNDVTKTQNTRIQNSPVSKTYLPNSSGQSNTKTYVDKSPSYNNYQNYNNQKRIPLVPLPTGQIQAPTGHPGLSTPKHPKQPLYYNFRKPPLTPQGFKPSHPNQPHPHQSQKQNQQLKLNQNYQPSERHEISIEREYEFEKINPNVPQDYTNNNYDKKRSKAIMSLSERYESSPVNNHESKIPTSTPYYNTWATRGNNYTKSLPSVIITASASVSDSNGKKLNYSVGNIVHAVKPLIQTNYDDYKESDVALDPFFLDVPKLKNGRNKRSSKKNKSRSKRHYIIKVYKYDNMAESVITPTSNVSTVFDDPLIPVTTYAHSAMNQINKTLDVVVETSTTSTTVVDQSTPWVPPDYVDDNYEPLVYQEPSVPKIEENFKSQVSKSSDIPVSTPVIVNKYFSKNISTYNSVDEKNIVNSELTTNSYVGKTTLDLVKIENTTPSVVLNNATQKAIKRYRLVSVNVVNLLENDCENCKFSCKDKKYHKFYPDKNCRTFHMCSPSVDVTKVLNLIFICDLGYYFNSDNCTPSKPNDCENKNL